MVAAGQRLRASGWPRASSELRAVGRDRSEHGDAERAGDLHRDVDDAGGEAGVGGRHLRHRDRQQRHRAVPMPAPIRMKATKTSGK